MVVFRYNIHGGPVLPLLNLACANCSAPLQIGDDLERFTCSYCGTAQIVERSGGVISTKKITSAIHAVQRGTDRTAAELAIPRLTKELAEAQDAKNQAAIAAMEKITRAKSGRKTLTAIVFIATAVVGLMALSALSSHFSDRAMMILGWAWLALQVVVPTYVFMKVKLPQDMSREQLAPHDAKIARIQAQIKANREILDAMPS